MELGTPSDGLYEDSGRSQSWWRRKAVSRAWNFEGRKPRKKTQVQVVQQRPTAAVIWLMPSLPYLTIRKIYLSIRTNGDNGRRLVTVLLREERSDGNPNLWVYSWKKYKTQWISACLYGRIFHHWFQVDRLKDLQQIPHNTIKHRNVLYIVSKMLASSCQ